MNTEQFNSGLINQDHTYSENATYWVAFNWFDLTSLWCSYYESQYLQETTLWDVYWNNILDVNWVPLWVLERKRVVYQKMNSTVWIMVQSVNAFDVWNIDLTSFVSSLADWGGVINKKYSNRNLVMSLFIQWATPSDLIKRIDTLKQKLQAVQWNLDIRVNGELRRYEATVSSITIPSFKKSSDYLEWIDVEFLITSPHWKNPTYSQVFVQWMTSDFSKVVQNEWTYKVYPVIQVITNPGSTLSALSITHKRVGESSWYTISITTSIPSAAVVVFDYVNKTVTVNGTEVNFSWVMMPMAEWQSVFSFDFTWTINVNTYILHNPTYS